MGEKISVDDGVMAILSIIDSSETSKKTTVKKTEKKPMKKASNGAVIRQVYESDNWVVTADSKGNINISRFEDGHYKGEIALNTRKEIKVLMEL